MLTPSISEANQNPGKPGVSTVDRPEITGIR